MRSDLKDLIKTVLRTYTNAFVLHEQIVTSPLWAHSQSTEKRVEHANLAAYFKKLAPLPMAVAPLPTVHPWPAVHVEVDTAALHRQAMREHLEQQEAQDEALLDRLTNKAPAKPGILARLGLAKGGE